jgi:hypothetical protein
LRVEEWILDAQMMCILNLPLIMNLMMMKKCYVSVLISVLKLCRKIPANLVPAAAVKQVV